LHAVRGTEHARAGQAPECARSLPEDDIAAIARSVPIVVLANGQVHAGPDFVGRGPRRARDGTARLECRGVNVVYEPSRGQRIWAVRDVDLARGLHHPYTEALLDCYADPRADEVQLSGIPGSAPGPG